ncbi:MAG: S-adenosylmethionine decarboxylase, partial [Spirochaetia bacterium]|nr:S-adenosylmethionine decarboxylase [Spirochaetia bacterium]
SCEPNCGIRGQSGIVALRDIAPGEEITVDYAMYQTVGQEFDCQCGTPSCRRAIRGEDYMALDLRDRYRGYFSTYVHRRQSDLPDESFLRKFEATGAWGLLTSLDLHDCDPTLIRSADAIRQFTYELADRIKATRFGEPMIVHFGADDRVAGYSLVQLIETSLISAHFANLTNRVYLDVFSCAYYEPKEVAAFAQEFFRSKAVTVTTNFRY